MSNFLSKFKMKTAENKMNRFNLSSQTVATSDFYRNRVVYIKEMVQGEKCEINMESFTRLAPLARPTFMRCRMVNRAFFVRANSIFPEFSNFLEDTPVNHTSDGTPVFAGIPTVRNSELCALFTGNTDYATVYTGTGRGDVIFQTGSTDTAKYRFTTKGKQAYALINGLGYKINWTPTDSSNMSALPLMSFMRIWYDWMRNPNFANNDLSGWFKNQSSHVFTSQELKSIFDAIMTVDYERDYYTSAWMNPVAPNGNAESVIAIADVTVPGVLPSQKSQVTTSGQTGTTGTPLLRRGDTGATATNISQYILDALHRATDYVKRNQLAGSRVIDRMLAQTGKVAPSLKMERSIFLGEHEVNIQIGDIMSTSDTEGASLGDYSGKGVGFNSGHIKYEAEETGYLVITSCIIPTVQYTSGRNPIVKRISHFDFFDGARNFDNLGTEAIPRDILISNYGSYEDYGTSAEPSLISNNMPDSVFGYLPRFSSYKASTHDNLIGDFTLGTLNEGMSAWYCSRPIYHGITNSADFDFNNARYAQEDLEDIWMQGVDIEGNSIEHFYCFYNFNVVSYMPMKRMLDIFDPEDGHDYVTMDLGGTELR